MQVGDLVELSARGNKVDYLYNLRGLQGIVLHAGRYTGTGYMQLHWFGRTHAYPIIGMTSRKHLKIVKVKK